LDLLGVQVHRDHKDQRAQKDHKDRRVQKDHKDPLDLADLEALPEQVLKYKTKAFLLLKT
jgi:hypothetical protein